MELLPLSRTISYKSSSSIRSPCNRLVVYNERKSITFSHCRRFLFSVKSQIQKQLITCAGNRRRRQNGQSSRSAKLALESIYHIASRLKIVPEPLDFFIKMLENGGGNGGGFWIPKGFGWGDSDGWGKRKRIRRSKTNVVFLCIAVIMGIGIWMIRKEISTDVLLRVLGFMVLSLSVYRWKTTKLMDWVLGFSSCAALVGLVMEKEDFQKMINNNPALKAMMNFRLRKRKSFLR